jgi:hypothetical protein
MTPFDFIICLFYFFMAAEDMSSAQGLGDNNNFETHIADSSLDSEDSYGQLQEEYTVAPNILDNQQPIVRNGEQFQKTGFFLNPNPSYSPDSYIGFQNETREAVKVGVWRKCKTSTSVQPNGGNTVLGAPYYVADLGPGRTSDAVLIHPALQVRVEATWPTMTKSGRSLAKGSSVSEIQNLPQGKGRLTLTTEGNAVVLKFDSSKNCADDRIIIDVGSSGLAEEGCYRVFIMQKGEVVAGPFSLTSTSQHFVLQFTQDYLAAILQSQSTGKLAIVGNKQVVVAGEFLAVLYVRNSKITREIVCYSVRDYNQSD